MGEGKQRRSGERGVRPGLAIRLARKLRLIFAPRWMREYYKFERDERRRRLRSGKPGEGPPL